MDSYSFSSDPRSPFSRRREVLKTQIREIKREDLKLFEVIGKGSFGDVYRARWHGSTVAVKKVRKMQSDSEFLHEASINQLLGQHQNVVPFMGACLKDELAIVLGYCPHRSLEEAIVKQKKFNLQDEKDFRLIEQMILDASGGLLHLHHEGVIHRDVSARNFLLDALNHVLICDFGLSRFLGREGEGKEYLVGQTVSLEGPLKWMAPEALTTVKDPQLNEEFQLFSEKTDVYMFGIFLWEIMAQSEPWPGLSIVKAADSAIRGLRPDLNLAQCPKVYKDLISACWSQDPKDRPTMQQVNEYCLRLVERVGSIETISSFADFTEHYHPSPQLQHQQSQHRGSTASTVSASSSTSAFPPEDRYFSDSSSNDSGGGPYRPRDSSADFSPGGMESPDSKEKKRPSSRTATPNVSPFKVPMSPESPLDFAAFSQDRFSVPRPPSEDERAFSPTRPMSSFEGKDGKSSYDMYVPLERPTGGPSPVPTRPVTKPPALNKLGSGYDVYLPADAQLGLDSPVNGVSEDPYALGLACYRGKGRSKDYAEAIKLFRISAERGNLEAYVRLGQCYETGNGVKKDPKEAFRMYRLGAEKLFPLAVYHVAVCYDSGIGVAKDIKNAIRYYTVALEKGYLKAAERKKRLIDPENKVDQFRLGLMYYNADGIEKDLNKAVLLIKKSASQGYGEALTQLAYCYWHGLGVTRSVKKAIKYNEKAAKVGDASGMYNLGLCYEKGRGMEIDIAEAVRWYHLASLRGYENAKIKYKSMIAKGYANEVLTKEENYEVGLRYYEGKVIPQDYKEALKFFHLAGEEKHAEALYSLGQCYELGQGVVPDVNEALKYYHLAVAEGHGPSMYVLGVMAEEGTVEKKDLKKAVLWFKRSSNLGQEVARKRLLKLTQPDSKEDQHWLGMCYYDGDGVKKDYRTAIKYFSQAAQQKHVESIYLLGFCYYRGYGVNQDFKAAVRWFHEASDLAHPQAAYYLGLCYWKGNGVEKDILEALKRFELASEEGFERAEKQVKKIEKLIQEDPSILKKKKPKKPVELDRSNSAKSILLPKETPHYRSPIVEFEILRREKKMTSPEQPLDFREGDVAGRGTVVATQRRILIIPEGSTEPISFLIESVTRISVTRQLVGAWENFCVAGVSTVEKGVYVLFKVALGDDNTKFVQLIKELRIRSLKESPLVVLPAAWAPKSTSNSS